MPDSILTSMLGLPISTSILGSVGYSTGCSISMAGAAAGYTGSACFSMVGALAASVGISAGAGTFKAGFSSVFSSGYLSTGSFKVSIGTSSAVFSSFAGSADSRFFSSVDYSSSGYSLTSSTGASNLVEVSDFLSSSLTIFDSSFFTGSSDGLCAFSFFVLNQFNPVSLFLLAGCAYSLDSTFLKRPAISSAFFLSSSDSASGALTEVLETDSLSSRSTIVS
jgi:hypothetical protein